MHVAQPVLQSNDGLDRPASRLAAVRAPVEHQGASTRWTSCAADRSTRDHNHLEFLDGPQMLSEIASFLRESALLETD